MVKEKVSDETDVCVDSLLLQVLLALDPVGLEPVLDTELEDVPAEVVSEEEETGVLDKDVPEVSVEDVGALELRLELMLELSVEEL